MEKRCEICNSYTTKKLCIYHSKQYMWDKSIQGYRLKKKSRGSRYTTLDYHKNEIRITKILEEVYGRKNIITSYHPKWALSDKMVLLEFDIYIKNLNILIEVQGIQHYEYTPFFNKSYKGFIEQKKRDSLKFKLAKENNIKLIYFKYDEPVFKNFIINKIERNKNGN